LIIEKQANFSEFYKTIKGSEFNNETLIFDKIEIEDIILLGVNSNYIVNQNGGHGFLPIEQFESELKYYRETYPMN
jgi:hypothetical protein